VAAARRDDYCLRPLLHALPASPARLAPSRKSVEGSGTDARGRSSGTPPPTGTVRPPLKPLLTQPIPRVFISMVTAPVSAKALPQPIVAWVFKVMLVSARIFPWKEVVVSRVADLPTFQNTPAPEPVLTTFTAEPGEVIRVLPIWNTQAALGVALTVERECSRQIANPRGNRIDARKERESGQIRRL